MIIEFSKTYYVIASMNLAVCLLVAYMCICRLNSRASAHFKKVRIKFILLLVGSIASGLQPLFWATLPDVGSLTFSSAVCLYMIINRHNRRG